MAKRQRPKHTGKRRSKALTAPMVDAPSPRLRAAHSLWVEGRRVDALSLYSEAIRQEPNNVRAYVMAARAYAEMFNFDGMEQTHQKLIGRAPHHPGVHHYVGETFNLIKLPKRAIESFECAAKQTGAGPATWVKLASLYERAHRLDEAEELINRSIRASFDLPAVSLIQGRIQRRQNRLEKAESTFHSLIARLPENSELAGQAWSELALMLDRAGEYDAAADAMGRCKRVQKLHEAVYWDGSEKLHSQMRELIANIRRDHFTSWRDAVCHLPARRVALLTGFPRSGTTLLEQVLDAHPGLVSSEERDFIGREVMHTISAHRRKIPLIDVLNELEPDVIASDRQRYFRAMEYLLGEPIGGRMHLDKNPAYNMTIPLVLRLFPETRLIVALRDPRDVVLSCYLRYLPLNAVSVRFLNVERTADRYALDMMAWLKIRDIVDVPWCEIRYEDAIEDLEIEARRALETLGLPWNKQVLNYRQRMTGEKQITSPSYEAVAEPIYRRSIGRWKNYTRLLEPALKTLEPFISQFGYSY